MVDKGEFEMTPKAYLTIDRCRIKTTRIDNRTAKLKLNELGLYKQYIRALRANKRGYTND